MLKILEPPGSELHLYDTDLPSELAFLHPLDYRLLLTCVNKILVSIYRKPKSILDRIVDCIRKYTGIDLGMEGGDKILTVEQINTTYLYHLENMRDGMIEFINMENIKWLKLNIVWKYETKIENPKFGDYKLYIYYYDDKAIAKENNIIPVEIESLDDSENV